MSSYSHRDYAYCDRRDHEDSSRSQRRDYDSYHPSEHRRERSRERQRPPLLRRRASSSYSPNARSPALPTTNVASPAPMSTSGSDTGNNKASESSDLASRIVRNLRSAEIDKAKQRLSKCKLQHSRATAEQYPDHPSIVKQAKLAYADAKEHLKKTQDDTKDLEACFAEILKATGIKATDTIEQQPKTTTDAAERSKLDERLGAIAREQEAKIKKLESDLQTRFDQSITDSAKRIQEDFDKSLNSRTEEIQSHYTAKLEAKLEEHDKRIREHYDTSLKSRTEEMRSQYTAMLEENDKRIREHYDEKLKTYVSDITTLREQFNKWQEAMDLDKITDKQASIMKSHDTLAAKVQDAASEQTLLQGHVRKLDERLSLPPKPGTADRAVSELKTELQNLEDRLSARTGEIETDVGSLKSKVDVLEQSSAPQETALTVAAQPNSQGLDPDLDKIQYAVDQIKMDLHNLKKNVVDIFRSQSLIPDHLKDWAWMATPTRQQTPVPQVQATSEADGSLATVAHVETTRRHLEELYKDRESFVDSVVACIGPRVSAEIAEIRQELISKGESITSCQGDINACRELVQIHSARLNDVMTKCANDRDMHRSLHDKLSKYCKDVHEDLDMRCRNLDHWQQNFETTDLVNQMTEYIKALMPGEISQMRHKVAAIETELRRIQDHAAKRRKVSVPNGGIQAVPMAPVHPS
ncbi:uncharacterized protein F5Z01DRAFT_315499 [Emericellopsis atlantica]|uniref:Uncharacterized protein n=1 Tax=Emericellopsis atlantica TaxID=2614577 RepID=A0A9P8CSP3_9HYPO|nr:uncharacterized protein F5Z01DRAFT_315499 [Emericellopsis atlantica]KAG9258043.1 hypothetical protein F5Z01DRAFT_315499 [Emericellopsis atlantica]